MYRKMLTQPYFHNNVVNEFVNEGNVMAQLARIIESLPHVTPVAKTRKPKSELEFFVNNKLHFLKLKMNYYLNRY